MMACGSDGTVSSRAWISANRAKPAARAMVISGNRLAALIVNIAKIDPCICVSERKRCSEQPFSALTITLTASSVVEPDR